MKVIIPVAGIGNRLKPHTSSLPKPLIEVAGKTILDHILDPIMKLEPEEVVFVIGFRGEQIKKHIAKNKSINATFVQQAELAGLGFALHLALSQIEDSPLLVILGDTIVDCDCSKFVRAGENVLGLRQVDDPSRFGIAEVADGIVTGVEEKPKQPKTNLALIGLYYFQDSAMLRTELDKIVKADKRTRGEIQLTDALQGMIAGGTKFSAFEVNGWFDCGKKETLLETNHQLLSRIESKKVAGCAIIPPVFIADTATVTNSVVGPNVTISSGAHVENSVISNSIIGSSARVCSSLLTSSVIGQATEVQGKPAILNIGASSQIGFD